MSSPSTTSPFTAEKERPSSSLRSSAATSQPRMDTTALGEQDREEKDDPAVDNVRREPSSSSNGEGGRDTYEVRFAPDDPEDPHNWSRRKRWYITALAGIFCLNATFSSSSPSGILPDLMVHFGFGQEVASLLIALFVGGYCVGPLLWGPLSEAYGRKYPMLVAFIVYTLFQVGSALAPNTAAILVFRLLGGMFASSPLVVSGALIADVWDAKTRGKALSVFALAPLAGPALGPCVSGFMADAGVSWRWTFWVLAIFAGACTLSILLTLPETYTPTLLVRRAQQLRKDTGDVRWWAPLEKKKVTFAKRLEEVLARPFQVFFYEPMLIAITVYMSFIYGCVYLLFEAYPIVFTEGHHFNAGTSGLMFLPIFVGGALGVFIYLSLWSPRYQKLVQQYAPHLVPPEARLEQAIPAAPLFALSFFWFGWTSYPSISFWAPLLAGGMLGLSMNWIFMALLNYTIDAYLFVAASALAASTVIRSIAGAGFPLFATQMFVSLNPRWASTLLGFVALIMMPIPFVLTKYGPVLRRKSKYAPTKAPPPPKKADVEV